MSVTYLSEFLDAEDYARYILQLLRETDLAIADHTAKLYGFIK